LFWDPVDGGWFSTTGRDSSVLLRMKEEYDGAEPSASSVSVLNLLTLSHLVHEPTWVEQTDRTFRYFGSRLEQIGRAVPMMAAALATSIAGLRQIVVVGERGNGTLENTIRHRYLPFTISLLLTDDRQSDLAAKLPFIAGMHAVDGRPAAYVCRDFTCQAPVTDRPALEEALA